MTAERQPAPDWAVSVTWAVILAAVLSVYAVIVTVIVLAILKWLV